ncbi:hypothetical protein BXO88_05665 [Oribacterium sp. C9]|uniref:ABC transporter substrate-binding protein n=1 Tax=Oribacterium sp. C9 TaxID=1943579 RepID=UPI00098FD141|nr:ABC transporter substrate-binding protein [Oribacterium sp. C9]OON87027.1 hypothetical protein BXO88_05665 [Oribacterium sp. C9]
MKKNLYLTLALAGMLALTGCGNASNEVPEAGSTSSATETGEAASSEAASEKPSDESSADVKDTAADSADTITVTDMNGREVTVPKDPDSVVLTALPLPSIYALTGAPIENLKGIHPGSTSAIANSIMGSMYPDLVGIADNFVEGQDINVEELLKIDPDVVIYWGEYENQYEALKSVNIPAVGVFGEKGGNVVDTLKTWVGIMGQLFGTTGNTDKVIDYANEALKEVDEKVSTLSDKEKPKVLYLYNHSKEQISASGSGFYGGFWIDAAGGNNVAKEIENFGDVNMEQIYEWDPDIIILTTFTETMPDDLYNNSIEGQDWSQVSAVKNGKVYKEPLGVYRWYVPCGDTPLMVKWMAKTLHPELFDYDMIDEIKKYYKEFYDYDVTDEQAQGILDASPEAAKGTSWNATRSGK